MSGQVQPKALSAEALRKQIYRAKLKEQLGEAEYKNNKLRRKELTEPKLKQSKTLNKKLFNK
jgi:hypothetical protein